MRDKLLQLAFGFPLNVAETQQLLLSGRHRSLYARDKRDSVLLFCLSKGLGILETEDVLARLQLEGLMNERDSGDPPGAV
jgi:hypothetical protein